MVKMTGGVKLKGFMRVFNFVGPLFWDTARAPWTTVQVNWENWD